MARTSQPPRRRRLPAPVRAFLITLAWLGLTVPSLTLDGRWWGLPAWAAASIAATAAYAVSVAVALPRVFADDGAGPESQDGAQP